MDHLAKVSKQVKLLHCHMPYNVKKDEGMILKPCPPSVVGRGVARKEPTRLLRHPSFNTVHFGVAHGYTAYFV